MTAENDQPYRGKADSEPGLRDTGRAPKYPDEREHMSTARTFDNLAGATLALTAALGRYMKFTVALVLAITVLTIFSTALVLMGQRETRDLIVIMSKRNCGDVQETGTQKTTTTTIKKETP